MSTMVPVLLSLLLLLGLANTQNGHYFLTFHYTGVSTPNAGSPSFQATVYLNGIPFIQYNSESQVAEPLGPWRQMKRTVDWKEETQLLLARQKTFMETLRDINSYSQDGGNHTLEANFGCDLRDNNYCGAFWTYIYDGREYIKFAKEIPAWFPRQTIAVFTKVKWESEGSVQAAKAYLEQECPRMLRKYLQYSKTFLDHQDPPSVSITSQEGPGNIRTLKCLAYDFFPGAVSMYWTKGDEALETHKWGRIVLDEDGTYHSWVTVKVPSSDTGPYFCHVQHSSLAQALTVPWNEGQESGAESAS